MKELLNRCLGDKAGLGSVLCQSSPTWDQPENRHEFLEAVVMQGFLPTFLLLFTETDASIASRCNRESAKTVRHVVRFKLWDIYHTYKTGMPPSCPFSLERDVYYFQEKNKMMENYNHWKCNFCGKAFLAEIYLDRHFERKHPETIQESQSSVCLSDYCDVFRCDVLSGSRKPDFWDVALCIEDDMTELKQRCMNLIDKCVPKSLSEGATRNISSRLFNTVCSFLTCDKFWDVPPKQEDSTIAMYIIMSILITFTIVVYYCIFYQYYYTDAFSDNMVYDPMLRRSYPYTSHSPKGELRQRAGRP